MSLSQTQKEASEKALDLKRGEPSSEPKRMTIHWSERMLPMKEAFEISGRSSSSYYRDVQAGRMPGPVSIGGSSRVPGWDLWDRLKGLTADRDDAEAA